MSTALSESVNNSKRHLTIPAYRRIEDDLRSRIAAGQWLQGAVLPSRRELATEYGVDLNTLQRAISALVDDGTLQASPRRGTIVARGAKASSPDILPNNITSPLMPGSAAPVSPIATHFMVGIAAGTALYLAPEDKDAIWRRATISALENALARSGSASRLYNWYHYGGAIPALTTAQSAGVDAQVIVALFEDWGVVAEAISAIDRLTCPVVVITSEPLDRPVLHVYYEQRSAGYLAAQHLLHCGYQHLLFLAPFTARWVEERLDGARLAVEQANLPGAALRIYSGAHQSPHPDTDQRAAGYSCSAQALDEGALASSGVIAINDNTALGVMDMAESRSLQPGTDFGLLGFDDIPEASERGLTSVRPPLEAMGEEAARMLMRSLQGDAVNMQACLHSTVVRRASTWSR